MSVDIQSLLQECDDTISQITSQLDQISTQEQQHPELRELLDLKKQFLERIRKLLKTEVGGIRRIIQFLLYKDKKIYQFLERFKQDLETFNQYFNIRNDLNPHSLQSQLQLLRTEYEIFLKDDVELQKLLQLRRQAQDEPNKRFEDTKNKVFKIMQSQFIDLLFGGLSDNIENTIFSQQGVYLFTLLYEISESDETYEIILLSGFARGIFQVSSIQQLSPPELLQIIQEFINLRSSCQSDATYENILIYGFTEGIFQVNSIQQLSPSELLQIIQDFGQQLINLQSSCQSDEMYRSILRYGFPEGILLFNSVQQLSPSELLQIIQEFINLRSSCRSDATYENILLSGFARGIFEVNSIQQLSPPDLLQVISRFGQQFIVLEKLTQNSFKTYLRIITKCNTLQIEYLISIVKNFSSKSLSILEFLSTITNLDTILNDENKRKVLEYFYTHSKILLLSQYGLYLNQINKEEFLQSQEAKLQTIINGTYEGEITDELASIANYIFYPSQISYSFDQYKQTLESHQDNQNHIPQSLRDKKVKVTLSSTIITKRQNSQLNEELVELDKVYEEITNYVENNNYQFRENILEAMSQFTFNNQVQELYQNNNFKYEIKNIIIELVMREYYSRSDNERIFPFQKSLEDEYEAYIYYQEFINDTLNDLKTHFKNVELQTFQQSQILQSQLQVLQSQYGNIKNEKGREAFLKKNNLVLENGGVIFNEYGLKNFLLFTLKRNILVVIDGILKNRFFINKGKKEDFTFEVSKKRLHSCALMNMGVCIGNDEEIWNKENYWQLIIFDENTIAQGGVIMYVVEHNNKKWLLVSINPTPHLTSLVTAKRIYHKLLQALFTICKQLNFGGILIPVDENIQSNRKAIQEEIKKQNYFVDRIPNFYFGKYYRDGNGYYVDDVYVVENSLMKKLSKFFK